MKRWMCLLLLSWLTCNASAGECDALRLTDLRLLPKTTFEVTMPRLLNGCFSGYLPEDMHLERGLYRFGVFRNGKLAVPFPVIEAGMDLDSSPANELKILAVSFADLDQDGRNDVMVVGQRVVAKGEIVFAQLYWNCGDRFIYDENVNSAIDAHPTNQPTISVKTIQRYIKSQKMSARCDAANVDGFVPFKKPKFLTN